MFVPAGTPAVAVNVIGVENPLIADVFIGCCMVAPAGHAELAGVGAVKPKSGPADTIVKLASSISKKIFPMASTLILAVVVGVLGTVIVSVPSFGVLATNTVGNVVPPS